MKQLNFWVSIINIILWRWNRTKDQGAREQRSALIRINLFYVKQELSRRYCAMLDWVLAFPDAKQR